MDRMASIELALLNEKTEMEYYENEAARSRNPLARAMFDNLAKDEEEHMRRIRGLHERLTADGSWPEDVPIEVAGTEIQEILTSLVAQAGSDKDHDDDDLAAIQKAIAFETKGELFYKELAESADNPMEREFFRFLSEIEREHRLSLTDTLHYLEDPQSWLEQHERISLDGA